MPKMVKTVTRRDPWDVDRRLAELELERAPLLRVRARALAEGWNATPFFPANGMGTLAYQYGTAALRKEFVGKTWKLGRPNGVEVIRNEKKKVQVVFANVDIACDDEQKPKPRSRKGSGAERACMDNPLFEGLPEYAPSEIEGWKTYYLMVDERGAAELTLPVVKGGTFTAWIERLCLSDGSDLDREPVGLDEGDIADDFDPQVIRKK